MENEIHKKQMGSVSPPTARQAMDEVFSLIYEELRRLASFVRRNEVNATINSTALVHEAWLKLKDSPQLAATETSHFKAVAAKAMRQVLVDQVRRRSARKRGGSGEAVLVALDDLPPELSVRGTQPTPTVLSHSAQSLVRGAKLLELDRLLNELSLLNPRQAQIVENRFFGGLNVSETAAVLGVSESSVERDWRAARAWLAIKIRPF
jgi:RNA polymerase sigma factor (sigma-70 family)